jgi:putative SOS response-associated peptidase YedK
LGALIGRETGKPLYSFTIITTHANAPLRPIHDRMPVMYRREMGRQWLQESDTAIFAVGDHADSVYVALDATVD